MEENQQEDMTNLIKQQIEDYGSDPTSKDSIQDGLQILKYFIIEGKLEEFENFQKQFIANNKIPESDWNIWLDYLTNTELNPEKFSKIMNIFLTAIQTDYYPKIALSFMNFLLIGFQGEVLKYEKIKEIVENIILAEYAKDFFYSKEIFEIYKEMVSEKLKEKPEKMRIKALTMIEKRSLGYLHHNFEEIFQAKKIDNVGCIKRFEDLKTLKIQLGSDLNFILKLYNEEENVDSKKISDFFSSLILRNKDTNFILFAFEVISQLKCLTFDQDSKEKIWKNFLLFFIKIEKDNKPLILKQFNRAAQQNPTSIDINRQFVIHSNDSSENLNNCLECTNQRLFLKNKLILFKIYSYIFEQNLNFFVKSLRKIENKKGEIWDNSIDETIEYLKNLIVYFCGIIESYLEKKKSKDKPVFQARKTYTEILKNFLEFLFCLEIDDYDFVIDSMEKIVKYGGNNPNNWLFYLKFLGRKKFFGDLKKIDKIYWRALRFCSGDIFGVYLWMKNFNTIYGETKSFEFEGEFLNWVRKGLSEENTGKGRKDFEQILIKLENHESRKIKVDSIVQNLPTTNEETDLKKRSNPYNESEEHKKTIYIANLPLGFTQAEIIEQLTITSTIEDIRIINRKSSGSSICYIDFDSKQAALEAKHEINRKIIHGRKIYAEISKPPSKEDKNENTIFVNNLPYGMKNSELVEGLKLDVDELVEVRLKKTFAFIKLKSEEGMKKELKRLNKEGVVMRGRRIIIKKAGDKPQKKEQKTKNRRTFDRVVKKKDKEETKVANDEVLDKVVKKKKKSNKDFQSLFNL